MPQGPHPPIYKRDYPTYKYRELIATVGNDNEVRELIMSYGFEAPTKAVIRGWRTRNSIPGRWAPLLILHAVSTGVRTDIDSFVKGVQVKQRRNVRKPKAL